VILPAISVRQPWAALITRLPQGLAKNIENRSRRSHYRGPLLIHASKGCTAEEYYDALDFAVRYGKVPVLALPEFHELERGGIVGAVRMTGVIEPDVDGGDPTYRWHVPDCFGYQLADHVPLPFRPYKGALGLFRVELTPVEVDALRAADLTA
jgi:hypothetical protein